jgi:hypothetical protein
MNVSLTIQITPQAKNVLYILSQNFANKKQKKIATRDVVEDGALILVNVSLKKKSLSLRHQGQVTTSHRKLSLKN